MSTPLRMTFARLCRETRTMLDITQAELAAAAGVSRSHIAGIETGRVDPSLDLVWSIADRLGLDLQLVGRPPTVIDMRRGDLVHARCSGFTNSRLLRAGWSTARESGVVGLRTHGWIDLLAFDPVSRTLVIIELKTRLDDIGAIERQITWYEREAYHVATSMGWRPRRTVAWLILLASDEVESQVSLHRRVLRQAFPDRAPAMHEVLSNGSADAARRGLALIDPTSRRRRWLIPTRSDGRRSPAPFRDYAERSPATRISVAVAHTIWPDERGRSADLHKTCRMGDRS